MSDHNYYRKVIGASDAAVKRTIRPAPARENKAAKSEKDLKFRQNKQITEFFPIHRTIRKTKKKIQVWI